MAHDTLASTNISAPIAPSSAPVLSTPDTRIFEEGPSSATQTSSLALDDAQFDIAYEIARTVSEIRAGQWKRIALQFPDHMLVDAPRVFRALSKRLEQEKRPPNSWVPRSGENTNQNPALPQVESLSVSETSSRDQVNLFILADTSYGACCVDEVAAEHADADAVVHYGRTCLSPTSRLPVIYVFTKPPLDTHSVIEAFKSRYNDFSEKIILTADVPYMSYIPELGAKLKQLGYSNISETSLIRNPLSSIPNRTIPAEAEADETIMKAYQLFHVADPPPSLLLTLSSRVGDIAIYPANQSDSQKDRTVSGSATRSLQRRYALLTSLATASIFGILINTLSVRNYREILKHVKKQIADAGKKSYTFVVGKVNAAKVANFSEVDGWVVIGCWESSLFDSKDFWKPIITPYELELALKSDTERVWTGLWTSDFQAVLETSKGTSSSGDFKVTSAGDQLAADGYEYSSEEESEPPEFDLRTGRYVSHSRPMWTQRAHKGLHNNDSGANTSSLVPRAKGDIVTIGNQVSPAAEFFKNQRSWRGLGSDFAAAEEENGEVSSPRAAKVEQGRSGVARGYVVGDDKTKR